MECSSSWKCGWGYYFINFIAIALSLFLDTGPKENGQQGFNRPLLEMTGVCVRLLSFRVAALINLELQFCLRAAIEKCAAG
jgi:hypothetical protein